jgi:hypothetical protein
MLWIPVLAGIATYSEVRDDWTIRDLFDSFRALEVKSYIESVVVEDSGNK